MTTIAYDGTSIAVDSQCTTGNTKSRMNKMLRLRDGSQLFISGGVGDGHRVRRWLDKDDADAPQPVLDEKFGALLAREGQVYLLDGGVELIPITARFYAIGSGRDFAIAIMDQGLSAEDGVRVACKYDAYTGGPVRVYKL